MYDKPDYRTLNEAPTWHKKAAKKDHTSTYAVKKTGVTRVSIEALALIPEEAVWLESRKSERTRRAYRTDVMHLTFQQ